MKTTIFLCLAATLVLVLGAAAGGPVAPLGVVDGAIGCGGSSALVTMELTNCTTAPCDVSTGIAYDISMTFVAGESAESVVVGIYFYYPNGGVNRLSNKVVEQAIGSGISYRLSDTATIPERYSDRDGELSILVMNEGTGTRIACGIFEVVVAPNNKMQYYRTGPGY